MTLKPLPQVLEHQSTEPLQKKMGSCIFAWSSSGWMSWSNDSSLLDITCNKCHPNFVLHLTTLFKGALNATSSNSGTICPFLTHPSIPSSSLYGQIEYSTTRSLKSTPPEILYWRSNRSLRSSSLTSRCCTNISLPLPELPSELNEARGHGWATMGGNLFMPREKG